jgi:unsaturated chondroitin disaccharide hydrolase
MNYLTPVTGLDERPAGILTEGCFDSTRKLAPRHELIWGDYFLLEALLLVTGSVPIGLF